jgi:hypothetical protein
MLHNSLNQDELSALAEVSHVANLYQKPKLGKRYSILFSIVLAAGAIFFGVPAAWDPVAYLSVAISPSLEATEFTALFIRIRGISSLTLMVMIVFFSNQKN